MPLRVEFVAQDWETNWNEMVPESSDPLYHFHTRILPSGLWRVGWRRGEKRRPRRKRLGKISIDSLELHLRWTQLVK